MGHHKGDSERLSPAEFGIESARDRVAEIVRAGVSLPDRFFIVDVGIGVTIEDLIGFLMDHVSERPTLVCLDSISSFIDNMAVDAGDSFGMAQLRQVTRWTTGVAKLTKGQISFLLLSEINTEGRAKGRSLDHRCDYAISMKKTDDDDTRSQVKTIRTTKSWHGPTGRMADFILWHSLGRLCKIEESNG